ncbi:hypothetical protein F7725_010928 [Dissostichus mawsoni]|uniref:Uncharacterized protein n=1 Tax=Dissostichus mawsoni TaxID=36200 RepID=A0A7J5ZAN8_DISMA|nr:hypothetical protein F7725_010928 [Dissostichus mawsoni]
MKRKVEMKLLPPEHRPITRQHSSGVDLSSSVTRGAPDLSQIPELVRMAPGFVRMKEGGRPDPGLMEQQRRQLQDMNNNQRLWKNLRMGNRTPRRNRSRWRARRRGLMVPSSPWITPDHFLITKSFTPSPPLARIDCFFVFSSHASYKETPPRRLHRPPCRLQVKHVISLISSHFETSKAFYLPFENRNVRQGYQFGCKRLKCQRNVRWHCSLFARLCSFLPVEAEKLQSRICLKKTIFCLKVEFLIKGPKGCWEMESLKASNHRRYCLKSKDVNRLSLTLGSMRFCGEIVHFCSRRRGTLA